MQEEQEELLEQIFGVSAQEVAEAMEQLAAMEVVQREVSMERVISTRDFI
jgi:hypothetical protein